MEFIDTAINGAYLINYRNLQDNRGSFVKTFVRSLFKEKGIEDSFPENFYSVSKKHVIRGMHFQTPPVDHGKLVYCLKGSIQDVILDLRTGPDYGKFASFTLEEGKPQAIYIPRGVAHGFLSLTEDSLVFYHVSTEYSPENDKGINPLSFGFAWGVNSPLMSTRDERHPDFKLFQTPYGRI